MDLNRAFAERRDGRLARKVVRPLLLFGWKMRDAAHTGAVPIERHRQCGQNSRYTGSKAAGHVGKNAYEKDPLFYSTYSLMFPRLITVNPSSANRTDAEAGPTHTFPSP